MLVGQLVVVGQHGTLQLRVLAPEAALLGRKWLLRNVRARLVQRRCRVRVHVHGVPQGGLVLGVLVAVHLQLLETPVGQSLIRVRPHRHACAIVNQTDGVYTRAPYDIVVLDAVDANAEHGISHRLFVRLVEGVGRHGRKLHVGRHERRGDVVRAEVRARVDVQQANILVVMDDTQRLVEGAVFIIDGIQGQDLPLVVRVLVLISRHLLALRRNAAVLVLEWVPVRMRVQIGIRSAVTKRDGVEGMQIDGRLEELVAVQRLLELVTHERVTRACLREDLKMNVKEAEVYQEGQDNEAHRTSAEMLDKHAHGQTASDIQQIPQIQDDGTANGSKCEHTDHLARNRACQTHTCQGEPCPPGRLEGAVALRIEPDVAVQAAQHEQHERRIQENQARLQDVAVVSENRKRRHDGHERRYTRLAQNLEDERDLQSADDGQQQSNHAIRHIVLHVRITNFIKLKLAVKAREPRHGRDHELGKRGVHIEKVLTLDVVGGKFSKVHFIKHYFIRIVD